jgi:hypothetical protein
VQAYSARFTALGTSMQHLTTWLNSFASTKTLDVAHAAAALTAMGRRVLRADHVVIYRYTADAFWAIGPAGHWTVVDESGRKVPRPAAELGRGMAGYVAQSGIELHLADVKVRSVWHWQRCSQFCSSAYDSCKVSPILLLTPGTDTDAPTTRCQCSRQRRRPM